jgi:hypothetical protein
VPGREEKGEIFINKIEKKVAANNHVPTPPTAKG